MRSRACRICKAWHDLAEPWPADCLGHFGVQASAAPMIRTDGMEPVRSMLDGKMYDSRARYYGTLKAAGAEIVGNDKAPFDSRPSFQPRGVGHSIKRAIEELGG